jgi:hypothetical protein
MKILKHIQNETLHKVTDEKAAEMMKTGLYTYSTKGRFKSVLKLKFKTERQKFKFNRNRFKN